jgi:alpha-1,2-mannosyltransferase
VVGLRAWLVRPTLGDRAGWWLGVGLWIAFGVVICIIVGRSPDTRTVTPEYFNAARAWMESKPLYRPGPHGYIYLPHAAVLGSPFAALPAPWGDVVWRASMIAMLAWGVWRLAAVAAVPGERVRMFWLVTLMGIASLAAAARNGQANLLLTGLFVHAAVEAATRTRGWTWRTALLLWVGFAWKPIAAVPMLLLAAVFPASIPALIVGGVATLGLPYLAHTNWSYVTEQYRAGVSKVFEAGSSDKAGRFCDISGLLETLGLALPPMVMTAMRAAAALATLGLVWAARRRLGPLMGAMILMASAATYLMLFNPRTETNSYAIVGPWVALVSVWCSSRVRRPVLGWCLATGALLLGVAEVFPHARPDYVVRPMVAIGFALILGWWVLKRRAS